MELDLIERFYFAFPKWANINRIRYTSITGIMIDQNRTEVQLVGLILSGWIELTSSSIKPDHN